jgi:hypothetical protein
MLPAYAAGQLQVGHVGACNQQHRSHAGQQDQQRLAVIASEITMQRFGEHLPSLLPLNQFGRIAFDPVP